MLVLKRDHHLCTVCGQPAVVVDHILPWSQGGTFLDLGNLTSLCRRCHGRKTIRLDGACGNPIAPFNAAACRPSASETYGVRMIEFIGERCDFGPGFHNKTSVADLFTAWTEWNADHHPGDSPGDVQSFARSFPRTVTEYRDPSAIDDFRPRENGRRVRYLAGVALKNNPTYLRPRFLRDLRQRLRRAGYRVNTDKGGHAIAWRTPHGDSWQTAAMNPADPTSAMFNLCDVRNRGKELRPRPGLGQQIRLPVDPVGSWTACAPLPRTHSPFVFHRPAAAS